MKTAVKYNAFYVTGTEVYMNHKFQLMILILFLSAKVQKRHILYSP